MLAMLCLSAHAQYVPEGATRLYYNNDQRSGYGDYITVLVIYEQSGKYYLRRLKGFAGAASPVRSKDDKIYRLPDATMELSKKQVDKIRQLLAEAQLDVLARACMEEEQRNIDTGYTKDPQKGMIFGTSMDKGCWEQVIEWPGVLTGVNTNGIVSMNDYSNEHHKNRNIYLKAVSGFNSELHDIIGKYVKKNIKRLWREYEKK